MYINRGNLLKLILLGKRIFEFLNKHFYIILIISTITKYLNNKYYKFIVWLIKVFVIANIIFGISYILYFSFTEHSVNYGLSFYNDFISHILSKLLNQWNDLLKMWNDLLNLDDTVINQVSNNKDINLNIKNQVKDGIKEAIGEILEDLHEADNSNSNLYKNIALISSGLFLGYLIFILPGSNVTPVELVNYNWFNQSLIEFKINIINFFSSSNPGNSGTPGTPTSPLQSGVVSPEVISPVVSESSILSSTTITQATPNITNLSSPLTELSKVDASTQTILDGITVTKMNNTLNILGQVLPENAQNNIQTLASESIKTITD